MTDRHSNRGTVLWPREADVKRQVYALLRGFGATVYDLSQSRPSRVAVGIPDAYTCGHRSGSPPFGTRRKRRVGSSARHNGSFRNGANAPAWGMSSAVSVTLRPIYERSGCYKRMKDLEARGGASRTSHA